ncbi:MAG TPA: ATP-binding protein [Rectinemataceae bacterium]|nr:ATP-binding protein [Rectinemataceae bacterium]
MIKSLQLENLGPCNNMPSIEFGRRINLITGDNGLGKSFILDVAWWALTRRWPSELAKRLTGGSMAIPTNPEAKSRILFEVEGKSGPGGYAATFDRKAQSWVGKQGRPVNPGLVIYAMVDGSFAVWDPHRNYWRKDAGDEGSERQPPFVFDAREIWDGLRVGDNQYCNGLLADWASWQRENGRPFETLKNVLSTLSAPDSAPLAPGELKRISIDDARVYPTIRMPYGIDVPLNQCSAGMKRVFALAYLLVWSWEEHLAAGDVLGEKPANQITFLMDEIEAHLHPRWQRSILSSFQNVMKSLSPSAAVQLIAVTHSPLLLSSLEESFDPEFDAWFDLDFVESEKGATPRVLLTRREFRRLGDANSWLRSAAFDLRYPYARRAEAALIAAEEFMAAEDSDTDRALAIRSELSQVLAETDPFWHRWRYIAERKGWLP